MLYDVEPFRHPYSAVKALRSPFFAGRMWILLISTAPLDALDLQVDGNESWLGGDAFGFVAARVWKPSRGCNGCL